MDQKFSIPSGTNASSPFFEGQGGEWDENFLC